MSKTEYKLSSLALLLCLHTRFALASGYALPRATGEALGMADADVALAHGPAAQFINPANMLEESADRNRWTLGSLLGISSMDYSRPATAGGGAAPGNYHNKTGYPVIPAAAISRQFTPRLSAGLSADSPYGDTIEWPDHTWDVNLGPFGTADIAKKAELRVLRFGPAIAFKATRHWNFGARIFAQSVHARDENDLYTADATGMTGGAQLGVTYRRPDMIFASSYTTRTNTRLTGSLANINPAAASLIAGAASVHYLLPDRLQTGAAIRVGPNLWWETDLDWMGWSYVDQLTIIQANGTVANPLTNTLHDRNTLSYRTALKWNYDPHTGFYSGLAYDPSPVADQDVTPIGSMLRTVRFGLGASYLFSNGIKIDVAYQYIYGFQRSVAATNQDNLAGLGDTHVYEGTYSSHTNAIGVGVTGNL